MALRDLSGPTGRGGRKPRISKKVMRSGHDATKPASRIIGEVGTDSAQPLFIGKARPKYVTEDRNVFDAALDRMRFIFDEFDNDVTVSSSGGKDSTVVLELALMVARERGFPRGPLRVMWLDQECEFAATVAYQRSVADRPEVNMEWYQIPFRLSNSTNHSDPFLHVWDEDLTHTLDPATGLPIPGSSGWVRDKEPDSIWVNDFVDSRGVKAERFRPVLHAINLRHGGASLVGLRMEESPARRMTVTSSPRYKWVTWCAMPKVRPEEDPFWMFYPIYDWTYRDIWKAIHENGWEYNAHYDHLFQYGTPVTKMRVSNYHHETALTSLHFLQEIEPETWDRTTRRLQGVNVYSKQTLEEMRVTSLPYMFASWDEYVRYLISTLVPDPAHQARFTHLYEVGLGQVKYTQSEQVARIMVHTVLGNDLDGTTLDNALVSIAGGEKYEQLRTARNDALAAGTELPQTNTTRRKATFITRDNAKETMRS